MGYAHHALRGAGWNGALKIVSVLITASKIFVLAHLLTPSDFGLFSLVAIALGIVEATTETGINTTIIQSQRSIEYFIDTAWVIAILRGLIISIAMILIGAGMQQFYHQQQLFFLVAVASLVPFIKGFINPAIVTLQKEFRFFGDTLYQFSLLVADAFAAIVAGLIFHSVFAFLCGMLFAAMFEVTISFLFFRDRPSFGYIPNRAREIFQNAKGLNLSALLSYAVQNVDNLIVGKILGVSLLGIYANAYSLSHKLNLEFAKSATYGMFPVFVKIANDKKRMQRAFWKSLLSTMGLVTLISLPFFLFPYDIIHLFLGMKWLAAVPILRPLLIAGVIQSAIIVGFSVVTAMKKYVWMNASLLVDLLCMIPSIWILGQQYGLSGAVIGVLFSRVLALPIIGFGVWRALYAYETPER